MADAIPKLDREAYRLRFQSSRQTLVAALQHRQSCFARLNAHLDELKGLMRDLKVECESTNDDGQLDELNKLGESLQRQLTLSLIVFGRSNTGKSTLLNQLLRDEPSASVFPTAEHTCTARLTCASYGPVKTVAIKDLLSGQEIKDQKQLKDNWELRGLIELKGNEREDQNTAMLVNVTVSSELLQHNLRLVDSPGMGENPQMNEAVRVFLNSVESAIVVYVIDGTRGYMPDPDSENIRFLMEQHSRLQKVFIANRIDCCIRSYYKNLKQSEADELSDCDSDDEEAVVICLTKSLPGLNYTEHCQNHTLMRMESVRDALSKNHPGSISTDSETTLLGVSAKSVKDFFSDNWRVPHPPYLDSFLELEAHIATLVHVNARQILIEAIGKMKRQMMLATVHLLGFKLCTAINSSLMQTPLELMTRALHVINQTYQNISKAIQSIASDDSLLDLTDPDSELNSLKKQFIRDDFKSLANVDTSLVMRKAEENLIANLVRGKNREIQTAIRLLCNFKDVITSHLKARLKSKYQEAIAGSLLSQTASNIVDGLITTAEEFANDLAIIKSAFEPDDSEFCELCADHLVNGMRQALPRLVNSAEFSQIVASRSADKRARLLDHFLLGVDLNKLTSDAIGTYCAKLFQKKSDIEDRLNVQLSNLQQKSLQTAARIQRMKPLKRCLTVLHFKLIGLDTELRWTAAFDTSECEQLKRCQLEVSKLDCPEQSQRTRCSLRPRIDDGRAGQLLCRGLRLPADCLKRFAFSAMLLRKQLPSQLQLGWLCLDSAEPSSSPDKADAQLLLGVVSRGSSFQSLADLHPSSISDSDRAAWLQNLLVIYAGSLSAGCHYRPMDYRPSNVLIVRASQQQSSVEGDAGSVATPDPTNLLASPGQAAESASLAACIATLFGYNISASAANMPNAWDERYESQLQRAVNNPESFLAYLPSCLGARQDRGLIDRVTECITACLTGSASEKVGELAKSVHKLMSPS